MALWVEKIHMHVISLKMRESARQKERVQFSQHVGYAIVPRTETNGRATESALAGEQFRNHARLLDEFFKRRSRVFNRLLPRSAGAHTIWPGFRVKRARTDALAVYCFRLLYIIKFTARSLLAAGLAGCISLASHISVVAASGSGCSLCVFWGGSGCPHACFWVQKQLANVLRLALEFIARGGETSHTQTHSASATRKWDALIKIAVRAININALRDAVQTKSRDQNLISAVGSKTITKFP